MWRNCSYVGKIIFGCLHSQLVLKHGEDILWHKLEYQIIHFFFVEHCVGRVRPLPLKLKFLSLNHFDHDYVI